MVQCWKFTYPWALISKLCIDIHTLFVWKSWNFSDCRSTYWEGIVSFIFYCYATLLFWTMAKVLGKIIWKNFCASNLLLAIFRLIYLICLPSMISFVRKSDIPNSKVSPPQCARTDLNKRFLPKPMTTTGWKVTP